MDYASSNCQVMDMARTDTHGHRWIQVEVDTFECECESCYAYVHVDPEKLADAGSIYRMTGLVVLHSV